MIRLFALLLLLVSLSVRAEGNTPERQAELLALDWGRGNIRGISAFLPSGSRDAISAIILHERDNLLRDHGRIRRIHGAWSFSDRSGGRQIHVPIVLHDDTERDLVFVLTAPGDFSEGSLASVALSPITQRPAATPAPTPVRIAPAPYVNPKGFISVTHSLNVGTRYESEVTVLIPRNASVERPVPVILLLAGEGPMDEDGTIGFSKPIRDIAMGLADNGVATVRLPKRLSVYPAAADRQPGFNLLDEQVWDAMNAMRIALQDQRLDQRRIGVCGHDLGALAALEVAARAPEVTAIALLAPPPGYTIETAIERTMRYAEAGQGSPAEAMEARARSSAMRDGTLPEGIQMLGIHQDYWRWFDARDYGTSARLFSGAIFIAVPEEDEEGAPTDFAFWQEALQRHPRTHLRRYDDTGHDFIPGVNRMDPEMYTGTHHVSAELIRDLVHFFAGSIADEARR